jgi:hypothetical protein
MYVYGRPSSSCPTAPQYLVQLVGDEEDEGQQIYGLQSAVVPVPAGGHSANDMDATTATAAAVQGKPLLYVLTRHAVRQYQLPLVTLPA